MKPLSRGRGLLALRYTPPAVTLKMIMPGSLLRRSFSGLAVDPTARDYLDVEVPAGNGVGTARAIARAYSAFAEGGAELGITPETFARIIEPPVVARPKDEVIGLPSYFSLGFLRPGPEVAFGSSQRAFGSPGAGGSFGFADPDAQPGLRLCNEQTGLLSGGRPAGEGVARCGVPGHCANHHPLGGRRR